MIQFHAKWSAPGGVLEFEIPDEQDFMALVKVPREVFDLAVSHSARTLKQQISENAPYRTGELADGFIVWGPEAGYAKSVYHIVMDRYKNHIFQKNPHYVTKLVRIGGNNRKPKYGYRTREVHAYYPASMEYGFVARNGRYIAGHYFVRTSAVAFAEEHQRRMRDALEHALEGG